MLSSSSDNSVGEEAGPPAATCTMGGVNCCSCGVEAFLAGMSVGGGATGRCVWGVGAVAAAVGLALALALAKAGLVGVVAASVAAGAVL